jgi:phosphotriesterase-related protein
MLLLTLSAAGCASRAAQDVLGGGRTSAIHTVTGAIPAERLGLTLMHEHVLVDFVGADKVNRSRYDADHAFRAVLPHLHHVRALGCQTLVECTPAYLGRDPALLKRLADASGVHILTNTGYYGAAKDRYLPAHAFTETADQLAARWIREFEDGIEGTTIRPAFMKIGVDDGPLSEVDAKLVRAAAIAQRKTGLPIASHTSTGIAAMEQLDILERSGVALSSFIWVHAHNERDMSFFTRAATRGAWVEFDGVSPTSSASHVELVKHMNDRGLLRRVLVSHDAGWYRVGEPGGGQFRPYDSLFTAFVPALRTAGFQNDDVQRLLVTNPRLALSGST